MMINIYMCVSINTHYQTAIGNYSAPRTINFHQYLKETRKYESTTLRYSGYSRKSTTQTHNLPLRQPRRHWGLPAQICQLQHSLIFTSLCILLKAFSLIRRGLTGSNMLNALKTTVNIHTYLHKLLFYINDVKQNKAFKTTPLVPLYCASHSCFYDVIK